MKKTIIALLAIGSVAMADSIYWDQAYSASSITLNRGDDGINLSDLTEGALDITDISGYFISKVGNDTSPALGKVDITFTLTDVTSTNTLFTIAANSASQAGWGVTIKEGSLYLGQMTINAGNTTSAMHNYAANCSAIGTVTANTSYTLSVISSASTTGANGSTVSPGRGTDNFSVTLSTDSMTTPVTATVAGFGLNGSSLSRVYIGGSNSTSENGTFGNVTSFALSIPGTAPTPSIPEPTTAALSLLALAGLAARRRRK